MGRVMPGNFNLLLIFCIPMLLPFATASNGAQNEELENRPTIGLVLSGGGARGAAHAGVIKVLEELRIPVDYVAGTSMGAIVGGLYASGMTADEIVRVIESADWAKLLTDRPPRAKRSFRRKSDDNGFLVDFDIGFDESGLIFPEGFIQGQNLEIALKRLTLPVITVDSFDDLPIPFRAVATDIVTGDAVVLDSGDLADAMRASMSAPGIFKPVRHNGRILVDGGVVNNLPVQVVREMGADVLIVVDVGFPPLPEERLKSALAVSRQMLTILISARARDQAALLTPNDILISPDLGDFGVQDFQKMVKALRLGEHKAREFTRNLVKLSVSIEEYFRHREGLEERRHRPPLIEKMVVENESTLSAKVIAMRLNDQEGKLLYLDRLESDISDIYGFGTFETVTYDVVNDNDVTTLLVRTTEKSWGPNYLRFGINLEDDFDGNSSYNLAARSTQTEINMMGGEVRTEVQIGDSPRIFAELYQPLGFSSRWFVNPRIEFLRSGSSVFNDTGSQISKIGIDQISLSLDAGRQLGNWGELRAGITRLKSDSELRIGSEEFEEDSSEISGITAGFSYDTIDRFAVPRTGTAMNLSFFGAREDLGSDETFDLAELLFLKPQTWENNTILHWWSLGRTLKDETTGISPFSLGGLFSLSGYSPNELNGKHYGIGRLLYYHRLREETLPVLDTSIYLGASIEIGNVWQDSGEIGFDNTRAGGSIFVVFDNLLGPLYLAYGAAESGHRSAYLFFGQTF